MSGQSSLTDEPSAFSASGLKRNPFAHPFMFATGIEGSYPVIAGPHGERIRRDEFRETGHYDRWREDFALVKDLGIRFLRYGPPYYATHLGPGRYDWSFADETFAELERLGIEPIADLCHFGVPDWVGDFQNDDWPRLFAEYAVAFARRYPQVRLYTPVNEISVTARYSGLRGWWNERKKSDAAFTRALRNCARATILAEEAILRVRRTPLFVQSESTEYYHPVEPDSLGRADFCNELRFVPLDLVYGVQVSARMFEYLEDGGFPRDDYHWCMAHGGALKPYCIMGNDYYAVNEHRVPSGNAEITRAGRVFGYYVITREYYERYHLPVMHTETNQRSMPDAVAWLEEQWSNVVRLKLDGVPIIGFTWYGLVDQVDWDSLLNEYKHRINPLGLFDLDRKPRPVAAHYKELAERWRDIRALESRGLDAADGQAASSK